MRYPPGASALILTVLLSVNAHLHSEPASPPALMLAGQYQPGVELNAYWVSEKLDGVRAYWDGRQLRSRGGHTFAAPAWFTEGFPPQALDGELWLGRGRFEELSGAVRRQQPDPTQWRKIRFMVFDMPAATGSFDQRLARMRSVFETSPSPYIAMVSQYKLPHNKALMAHLDEVVAAGGEGLMLHLGAAPYRAGRSDDLLKLKRHQDAEAVVVAHLPGRGKYRGMLGAILVEMPDGQRFKIGGGFSDEQRRAPPPIGSVITYKYYGLTERGIPRFASFLRLREAF